MGRMVKVGRDVPRELWSSKYRLEDFRPEQAFQEMLGIIKEYVVLKGLGTVIVLSPFIYLRYARRFAEFVKQLRKSWGELKVYILTRPPDKVGNRKEHENAIRLLIRSRIHVCIPEIAGKFHAKAVILGNHVLAGSINLLAPSHGESFIKVHVEKLMENPRSARVLSGLLKTAKCQSTQKM